MVRNKFEFRHLVVEMILVLKIPMKSSHTFIFDKNKKKLLLRCNIGRNQHRTVKIMISNLK